MKQTMEMIADSKPPPPPPGELKVKDQVLLLISFGNSFGHQNDTLMDHSM